MGIELKISDDLLGVVAMDNVPTTIPRASCSMSTAKMPALTTGIAQQQ